MDLVIRLVNQHGPDELRRLGAALRDSDLPTGSLVLARERPLAPDRLGSWVDVISVAVGGGGAMTVFVHELARYLLRRHTDLEVEVSRGPDGTRFRLSAKGLRSLSASELEQAVRQIGNSLDAQDPGHEARD